MAVDPKASEPEESVQYAEFGGVNLTDARTRIADKEFYWLENVMPIGNGNLRLIPPQASSVTYIGQGIATMWGEQMTVSGGMTSLIFTVNNDGSMSQINATTGSTTQVTSATTVTTSARLAMWKDNPLLIADPTKGYYWWDGTTFHIGSATMLASDIAVFEGRVWLQTAPRTLTFTAPNSFTDFTAVNGGGSTSLTDSAFPGSITKIFSALEQLWIVGPGAVNAISNVTTTGSPLVTTFTNTNIVSSVGTTFPASVNSFFRTLVFSNDYGVYAIVGATPQKLSAKIDGLISLLVHTTDQPSAVGTVYDVFIFTVLVTYADPGTGTNRQLLLCFSEGKWFFAQQGAATWITQLIRAGVPEIWATDGVSVYQCFPSTFGTPTTAAAYKIQTKLFDGGDSTQRKEQIRYGLEFQSSQPVSATVTLETESIQQPQLATASPANVITIIGAGGVPITIIGAASSPITIIGSGLQLLRAQTRGLLGRYYGMTITGTSIPYILSCINWLIKRGGRWN